MEITNFTICGQCSNCGQCCSDFLNLDEKEIREIDKYLKLHPNIKQNNKGELNWNCPFRNETFKRCDIYEVRPQICRVFKCDKTPEQAYKERDLLNRNKKARSMAQLFFKDESKMEYAKRCVIPLKFYKRGEK